MKNFSKNIILWIIIGILVLVLFNLFQGNQSNRASSLVSFSDFIAATEAGNVSEVNIIGNSVEGFFVDGRPFKTYAPDYPNLVEKLNENGVKITAEPSDRSMHPFLSILLSWFPMLLLIGVWIFFMRQMQGGGGKALGFGKSKAKLLNEAVGKVTFDDVAGIDEAKQELEEVVEFLKDPKKFSRLGGKIPRGALLVGPPGTGKTLLARAIAGEANVPFFSISGSDFVEMFVGVGASRVRDMFEQGKKNSPCIIFIDEIDAVGRHRGAGLGGGNDEREQTLNQLLVEMDGFESNVGVIIVAATNRPDVLDPALLRPGRFDRQITVSNPDIIGRDKILKVHIKKIKVSPKFDSKIIARGTPGFSGADLANLVNEAALLAARKNKRLVTLEDFESAKDKVMMGAERRSMVMTDEEKKLTAYHEAGHAVATIHSPASDPIHKATIIPRGRALGMVMRLPEKDQLSMRKDQMIAHLVIASGGRIAEEMIFGKDKITNGAASDIQMVTNLSKKMITEWGMGTKLGRLRYNNDSEEVFLGHSVAQSKNLSDATAKLIDEEIRELAENAENECRKILQDNLEQLHIVAKGLLEYETLTGDEIKDLINGIKPSRDDFDNDPDSSTTTPISSVPKTSSNISPQTQ
ncbi:MAG: ATP-dependent zinc metalloprotease FtsH [Alphaproteobacteria bacterium MarineAlpha5_Bin8]|nr:MAG: ATP-dependent zinc metalloprotease FtsH [Alphaproteobacteria bacterium MarineAlpha5_Bin7]PPR48402.1 MAG: ATP-dependent zinc metalloprotease FtsH [Alphaproteobacteria bacterium MarineAlpha5_Bin8]PPR54399.1 MAG: ATP-dependent zinc metalloprotease FtsH [Alphaproteobacteria bacterium MarineAlpha5_Bin6]|tara:strand:- start:4359 stop:6263 length:1905 start_codon:yes stop_codon:yes gene_type:complete